MVEGRVRCLHSAKAKVIALFDRLPSPKRDDHREVRTAHSYLDPGKTEMFNRKRSAASGGPGLAREGETMPQGQIKKWVSGAEDGTILGDDGQDVGFRRYDLADPSPADSLAEGQRVEYEIKDSGSGLQGWNVQLLT